MRIIDADMVGIGMANTWQKVLVKMEINQTPTIDPETLPIVQELRKQLEQVTKERDKMVKDLKYYLEANEENGVVYIPKFIVEKIINNGL